ncbi:MAG: CofC family guanylyltransferase [Candidatus Methanofastidiosia archaeon]
MTHVVVLLKLKNAKSRLSPFFSLEQRRNLVLFMFKHVINILDGHPVEVLTQSIPSPTKGYDDKGNINSGIMLLRERIDDDILILPCDLPFLNKEDIDRLIGDKKRVIIARSHNGGTSGIFIPKNVEFVPHFGKNSFVLHKMETKNRNLPLTILEGDSFRDIDTIEDIRWTIEHAGNSDLTKFFEILGPIPIAVV